MSTTITTQKEEFRFCSGPDTHKQPVVMKWIASRNKAQERRLGTSRIHLHFTPTYSSWMNLVERFFRDLTVDCIRDGSFASTKELIASIENYLKDRDLSAKRYLWKAPGHAILEKIQRARVALAKNNNV